MNFTRSIHDQTSDILLAGPLLADWEISVLVSERDTSKIQRFAYTRRAALNNINEMSINVLEIFYHLFSFSFCFVCVCVCVCVHVYCSICRRNLSIARKNNKHCLLALKL